MMGRGIEAAIAKWYSGRVCFVTELRPGSVIKDDAIPGLIALLDHATFLTINEQDFWNKVFAQGNSCIVCAGVRDTRVHEAPGLLRAFFRCPGFRTKSERAGVVARLSSTEAACYTFDSPSPTVIRPWPPRKSAR